jgi:hypothetical protein
MKGNQSYLIRFLDKYFGHLFDVYRSKGWVHDASLTSMVVTFCNEQTITEQIP